MSQVLKIIRSPMSPLVKVYLAPQGPQGNNGATGATGPQGATGSVSGTGTTGQVATWSSSSVLGSTPSNVVGGMSLVATASPSGVSSFTISGLSSGIRYKLILNLTQNTSSGTLHVTFNGDSGANYYFQDFASYNGSVINDPYQNGNNYFWLGWNANSTVRTFIQSEMLFQTTIGNNNYVIFTETDTFHYSSQYIFSGVAGVYQGSSSLSSITFVTSAGTLTGTASLYQLN